MPGLKWFCKDRLAPHTPGGASCHAQLQNPGCFPCSEAPGFAHVPSGMPMHAGGRCSRGDDVPLRYSRCALDLPHEVNWRSMH
jgi:hypothetical protein